MSLFAPFLVPMAVGALTSLATNRSPIEGALIGAATQGLLGGIDFGGASSLFSNAGKTATSSGLTPTTTAGFGGSGMFGPSATSGLTSSGVATSIPQTTGGYSELLGGNTILDPYNVGMPTASTPGIGSTQGMVAGVDYPDYTPVKTDIPQTNGYVYSPTEVETMANLKEFGGMTGTGDMVTNEKDFAGLLGDVSASDMMAYQSLANNAYVAQTEPEQIETISLPPIARKEVEPSKGTLVAINSPRRTIDKKISFFG